jgi:hypothetical protein
MFDSPANKMNRNEVFTAARGTFHLSGLLPGYACVIPVGLERFAAHYVGAPLSSAPTNNFCSHGEG